MEVSEIDWSKFNYMVYDVPNLRSSYAERYAALGTYSPNLASPPPPTTLKANTRNSFFIHSEKVVAESGCTFMKLAGYEKCQDEKHLDTFFQDIIDKGGEGIILRDPASAYEPGMSAGYLKHKVSFFCHQSIIKLTIFISQKFRDAEAKVVGSAGPLLWECEL